jgi:Tfp pilus assembly protein PilN
MLEILKYQFKNNLICGLYCFINPDGSKLYRLVKVENKQGRLAFEILGEIEDDLSQLKEWIKDVPVYLILNGKGILVKNILIDRDSPLIRQVIPNTNENEFITDEFAGDKQTLYVAVCRKTLTDELVNQLTTAGINIISLALGSFRVVNLLNYFEEIPRQISVDDEVICYDREKLVITKLEKTDIRDSKCFDIDSKEVNAVFLPALSIAMEYFLKENSECIHPEILEQKKEFHSKIIFQRAGIAGLIAILILLLVNMLFYMHYSDHKNQIEAQLTGNKNILNTLDTLKKELEWKEKFMRESGILQNTRMAFYADQIAETVPEDIMLEKLEIHPIAGKIRTGKEIVLRPNIILLDGLTKSSLYMNDWVHRLKELPWVENVAIVNYLQEKDINTGAFSIELRIKQTTK